MARRSRSKSDSGGFVFKTGLFAILAGIAFWIFNQFGGQKPNDGTAGTVQTEQTQSTARSEPTVPEDILPASTSGAVVRHTYYTLSYSETHEQAEWVAYELNVDRLNKNWVERSSSFRPDPAVHTESATPNDYRGSGYDRGHLCPAADMAFNEVAMEETFFMSNMSPQIAGFNGGVWRELEECTRDWARKFEQLYVVTGPVLTKPAIDRIGFSKVTVPSAYYKVLLAPAQHRAIAFVLPHAVSDRPLMDYAGTIDQVEALTGIDFFPQLLSGLDEELEGSLDIDAWPVNARRYDNRVRSWNNRR
ncbi:MAG: DNA/RNA non-specific endonuclease [Bacteroidetes bacterium]|nr:MAG: DNA/RNA non-specific endonuclease [Bacteroidota bacterium]